VLHTFSRSLCCLLVDLLAGVRSNAPPQHGFPIPPFLFPPKRRRNEACLQFRAFGLDLRGQNYSSFVLGHRRLSHEMVLFLSGSLPIPPPRTFVTHAPILGCRLTSRSTTTTTRKNLRSKILSRDIFKGQARARSATFACISPVATFSHVYFVSLPIYSINNDVTYFHSRTVYLQVLYLRTLMCVAPILRSSWGAAAYISAA
jgi:hypothetical protein